MGPLAAHAHSHSGRGGAVAHLSKLGSLKMVVSSKSGVQARAGMRWCKATRVSRGVVKPSIDEKKALKTALFRSS